MGGLSAERALGTPDAGEHAAGRARSIVGRLAPALLPVALGVVLITTGHRVGFVAVAMGVLLLVPGVGPRIQSTVERVAVGLGHLVAVVALVIIHAVGVLPAWAVGRLLRHDPLAAGAGWVAPAPVRTPSSTRRQFRPARQVDAPMSLRQRAWNVVGVGVVLLLVNFGVGWAWDARTDPEIVISDEAPVAIDVPIESQPLQLPTPTTEPPFQTGQVAADDSRITGHLWKDVPWAAEYFWGMDANVRNSYPIIGSKPAPLRSPFFNVTGWERKSYEPASTKGLPVVWFFGGSTMFGMGQRDEYTIASEIARIAEEEGTPVVVRNFGQPRFLNWQEMLLFEQLLSTESTPEFAVFYDGINDVNNQLIHPFDQPSEHLFTGYLDFAVPTSPTPTPTTAPPAPKVEEEPSLWDDVYDAYTEHSAVHKLWNAVAPDAGSQTISDPWQYPKTEAEAKALGKRVHDIYARGRNLVSLMADDHDIDVTFYWQPQAIPDASWFIESRKLVDEPTIDLSDVLAGQDVFYDSMHTIESGARTVAEAQWETLGPKVREWYRDNG